MSWVYQPSHTEEKAKRGIHAIRYEDSIVCCDPSVQRGVTTYSDDTTHVEYTLETVEDSIEIKYCPFCGRNLEKAGA